MTSQIRNAEMVKLLSADFQRQYDSVFAIMAKSMYMNLLGLRGFWPLSAINGSGNYLDQSGNGLTLTNTNNVYLYNNGYTINSARFTRASSTYLHRADEAAFDILGTEAYVTGTMRGLTTGCWIYVVSLPSATQFISSKWNSTGNQRSYTLHINSSNVFALTVSVDGVAGVSVGASVTASISQWYFVAARFDPSTELALFVDNAKYVNTTSIPASIFNSTADYTIGASGVPGDYLDAYVTSVFLCTCALPDSMIKALYHKTRALYRK